MTSRIPSASDITILVPLPGFSAARIAGSQIGRSEGISEDIGKLLPPYKTVAAAGVEYLDVKSGKALLRRQIGRTIDRIVVLEHEDGDLGRRNRMGIQSHDHLILTGATGAPLMLNPPGKGSTETK